MVRIKVLTDYCSNIFKIFLAAWLKIFAVSTYVLINSEPQKTGTNVFCNMCNMLPFPLVCPTSKQISIL